jgi:hypothetical protein
MRKKHLLPFAPILALSLAACGGAPTPADQAAAACIAAAAEQLRDRPYEADAAVLAASARDEGDGVFALSGPLTVDAGRSDASQQTLQCRIRLADGAAPEVVSLTFQW